MRLSDHQIWLAQHDVTPASDALRMLYAQALSAYADALVEVHQREIDALAALVESGDDPGSSPGQVLGSGSSSA